MPHPHPDARVQEGLGSYLAWEWDQGRTHSSSSGLGHTAGRRVPGKKTTLPDLGQDPPETGGAGTLTR